MTPPDQEEIKSLTLQRDMLFESVDTAAQQLAALQKERDDFAYVMEAHTELQKQLLTLQKERNMLREQIRVADVAFQGLHERHQALQKEVDDWQKASECEHADKLAILSRAEKAERELASMTKMRDTYAEQFSKQSRLHGEFASQLEHLREDVKPLLKSVQSTLSIMPNTDRICTLGDVISVDEQNRHFELYRFAQQGRQEYQDFLSKHPELG